MNQVTVQTPTPSEAESISFYKKLGFRQILNEDRSIYTDGSALIEINKDRYARAGLRLYKGSWADEIKRLIKNNPLIDTPEGHPTIDPNGVWIYLIKSDFTTGTHSEYDRPERGMDLFDQIRFYHRNP